MPSKSCRGYLRVAADVWTTLFDYVWMLDGAAFFRNFLIAVLYYEMSLLDQPVLKQTWPDSFVGSIAFVPEMSDFSLLDNQKGDRSSSS